MRIVITILISLLRLPVAKILGRIRGVQPVALNFAVLFSIRKSSPVRFLFPLCLLMAFTSIVNAQSSPQAFSTSGTFTVPSGVTSILVESWGGGGAGGGAAGNGTHSGGGGGGGAYNSGTISVIPGNSYPVTVGTGGNGFSGANGSAGGASSFNGLISASGGGGGSFSSGSTNQSGGNAGSGGTGGIYNGGNGAPGVSANPNSGGGGGGAGTTANGNNAFGPTAGSGGAAYGGPGGTGVNGSRNGNPGSGFGGGGSGGNRTSGSGITTAGGNGAPGQVLISWSTCTTPFTASITAEYCTRVGYIRLTAHGAEAGATYLWNTGDSTNPIDINIADVYSVTITNSDGCSASATYAVSTELVINGDFSAGNTGFTHSIYIYEPDITGNSELNPEGHYGVGPDAHTYHSNFWGKDHTTGSGNFMIVNGYPNSPQPVVWATNVAVIPGVNYYFSAWALSLNSVGNYATLQFRVNGSLVGTTAPLPARPQNNNPPFNWIQFYGTWTAPAGVYSVPIEIVDSQTAASGNDFGLDDISFATLAPIPVTISMPPAIGRCLGESLILPATINGGKAPYIYSWTGPNGFSSTILNPSVSNLTSSNSGNYTLSVTDGYGCPVVTKTTTLTVNSPPPCSFTGSATVCPQSTGNIFTVPAGMAAYNWSISGNGSIPGSTAGTDVNVTTGPLINTPFTLSLTMTDMNGCSSDCQKVVTVQDNEPPTYTLPVLNSFYCVELVTQGLYNEGQENTQLDITYARPDYYLFATGSTLLNLSALADNCDLGVNAIAWTIDFANNGSIELSGNGQLSTYGSDIQFPLGTSRITYTVTDSAGNIRTGFVDLLIIPRPEITKNF